MDEKYQNCQIEKKQQSMNTAEKKALDISADHKILSVLLLNKIVSEVLDFQNELVRVSYGTDCVSIGKHWSVQVTTLGANTEHVKKCKI